MPEKYNDYQYLVAYLLIIGLWMLFIRSRFGYVTTYYGLVLLAIVLTLLNANKFGSILAPISGG